MVQINEGLKAVPSQLCAWSRDWDMGIMPLLSELFSITCIIALNDSIKLLFLPGKYKWLVIIPYSNPNDYTSFSEIPIVMISGNHVLSQLSNCWCFWTVMTHILQRLSRWPKRPSWRLTTNQWRTWHPNALARSKRPARPAGAVELWNSENQSRLASVRRGGEGRGASSTVVRIHMVVC